MCKSMMIGSIEFEKRSTNTNQALIPVDQWNQNFTRIGLKLNFTCFREEINQQLDWLYTNDVCAYPVTQGGKTAKVLYIKDELRGQILGISSLKIEPLSVDQEFYSFQRSFGDALSVFPTGALALLTALTSPLLCMGTGGWTDCSDICHCEILYRVQIFKGCPCQLVIHYFLDC